MATEALVTDQTAEGHVEEMKLTDDIKKVEEESCSQPKDLEGKDGEEKLKVEDSASVEASATESDEKPEDKKSDAIVEEVKKEAEDHKAAAVEVDEKELKNQADVTDIPEPPKEAIEKPAEDSEASFVQESESEATKEPAVSETVAEKVEGAEELPEVSSVTETEGEPAEPQLLSTVTEPAPDIITTPDASESAEISQDEKISAKELEVNPDESSKEEPLVTDSSKLEELFDKIQEAVVSESSDAVAVEGGPVNELEEVEGAVIPEEVPDVPEKTEADQNANEGVEESVKEENESGATDTSPAIPETAEALVKPEDKVEEEMEDKATVVEEPTMSEKTETDAATVVTEVSSEGSGSVEKAEEKKDLEGIVETFKDLGAASEVAQVSSKGEKASGGVEVVEKKEETLEGEKTTLVEHSRDCDVEGGKTNIITSADNLVNDNSGDKKEETEKADEQNLAESTKDGGEAPKQEVPAKPSQRHSNSIISKVKQSIVKVKKAIIGKSPSSKTTTAEGKDEIKV